MMKAIIFDCWGTLFTNSQSPHPFEQFANEIGHTMSNRSFVKSFEFHLMQDSYDDLRVPIKALLKDLDIPYDESVANKLKAILIHSIFTQVAYPDTMESLRRLKGKYALVLLTNSFKQGYEGLDKKFGISEIFDHVVTSFDAHRTKPDIKLFEEAIASTKVTSSEIVMIGDNLHDDIEPSSSLGMHTILLDRRGRYSEAKNRVTTLEEATSNIP